VVVVAVVGGGAAVVVVASVVLVAVDVVVPGAIDVDVVEASVDVVEVVETAAWVDVVVSGDDDVHAAASRARARARVFHIAANRRVRVPEQPPVAFRDATDLLDGDSRCRPRLGV
jgi:hypothetical protein